MFLMMMLLMTSSISAQAPMEVMDSIRQEADPMYDRPGCTMWKSEHMVFLINDNNTIEWRLINPPQVFVSIRETYRGQRQNTVAIGLFAANDSLLAKADKWPAIVSDYGQVLAIGGEGTFIRPTGEKVKTSIAVAWNTLKDRKGSYVRVIADIYGDSPYEVKARLRQ